MSHKGSPLDPFEYRQALRVERGGCPPSLPPPRSHQERKRRTERWQRSPHRALGAGDLFVEGFLGVSDPHHRRLELPGHLQGEGGASGWQRCSLWGAHSSPAPGLPKSALGGGVSWGSSARLYPSFAAGWGPRASSCSGSSRSAP